MTFDQLTPVQQAQMERAERDFERALVRVRALGDIFGVDSFELIDRVLACINRVKASEL